MTAISHLVSVDWLQAHLGDAGLVVLDCTFRVPTEKDPRDGHAYYLDNHIAGAQFADVAGALSDPDHEHRFMVPSPERFKAEMERLGVSDSSQVIVYSGTGMFWATRVWWLLNKVFGFTNVQLLDGGLKAWRAAGGEIASGEEPAATRGSFTPHFDASYVAAKDDVASACSLDNAHVLDALSPEYFRGEDGDMFGYGRLGHIAGAANLPTSAFYDLETGLMKPLEQIKAACAPFVGKPVITYCGGGIAATQVAFAMDMVGIKDVRVYDGSLQEWAKDPDAPMATGA